MQTNTQSSIASTPTFLVHKANAEGGLAIDGLTGLVIQPLDERPDWSEGLVCALFVEHHNFYLSRLGKAPTLASPLAFEDFSWVAVNAEGDELELEADSEHRMNNIAEAVGVVRTDDLSDERQDDTTGELAHVLTDGSQDYTHNEAKAFDEAAVQDFTVKTGTHND